MSKLANFMVGAATAVGATVAAGDALAKTFCMHSDGNPKTIAQHTSSASTVYAQSIWDNDPRMGKNDGCCIYQWFDGRKQYSDVTNGDVGNIKNLPREAKLNKCPMPGR